MQFLVQYRHKAIFLKYTFNVIFMLDQCQTNLSIHVHYNLARVQIRLWCWWCLSSQIFTHCLSLILRADINATQCTSAVGPNEITTPSSTLVKWLRTRSMGWGGGGVSTMKYGTSITAPSGSWLPQPTPAFLQRLVTSTVQRLTWSQSLVKRSYRSVQMGQFSCPETQIRRLETCHY